MKINNDTFRKKRISWIDQVKGFGIILVIYGHNLPYIESYIYSFHMPLFFFIGGLFHPNQINIGIIKKRAKQILIPYFLWSFLLFLFWFFIGRKYGDSSNLNLSVLKNFTGIFYAQGGHEYMNWGITMWFLPSIFFSFLFFGLIRKLKKKKHQVLCVLFLVSLGFLIPKVFKTHIIWSLDVSLVSLIFYSSSFFLKDFLLKKKIRYEPVLIFVLFIVHLVCSLTLVEKVDMFRSVYGNELLFLLNASVAIFFWLLLFKNIKKIRFLTFFGKNTIPILALHIRTLTVIKLFLLLFLGSKTFNFNEIEKLILVVIQLIILYPIIIFINKYLQILNGKVKAKTRD
ncbi:MAG: acyltransferase family protein [Polaribacter sp.]